MSMEWIGDMYERLSSVWCSSDVSQGVTWEGKRYQVYTVSSAGPDEFDRMVSDNAIDKDYAVDLDKASTTQDFVEAEGQYIKKWKSEWHKAIDELRKILNETDYQNYKDAQLEWEKQMLNSAETDRDILENTEYDVMPGSAFRWLYLSHIHRS